MKIKLIIGAVWLVIGYSFFKTSVKTLEPVKQDKFKESIKRGKSIYKMFCTSCHLPNGQGIKKIYPPLDNADYLINKQKESVKAVKYGLSGKIVVNGITYNNAMAPMGLSDQEVADVMNYINTAWSNTIEKRYTKTEVSKISK